MWATQLVVQLPLTIEHIIIADTVIKCVKEVHSLKELTIDKTLVGGEEGGQEVGLWLANTLSTNTTIEKLYLRDTDLIGRENVE